MQWKPNVTVATIAEQDGRYFLIEEIENYQEKLRKLLVLRCLYDCLSGKKHSLNILNDYLTVSS